ncbi:MAG: hypothetical protein ACLS7Z_03770 [Christensenellales bacterium]
MVNSDPEVMRQLKTGWKAWAVRQIMLDGAEWEQAVELIQSAVLSARRETSATRLQTRNRDLGLTLDFNMAAMRGVAMTDAERRFVEYVVQMTANHGGDEAKALARPCARHERRKRDGEGNQPGAAPVSKSWLRVLRCARGVRQRFVCVAGLQLALARRCLAAVGAGGADAAGMGAAGGGAVRAALPPDAKGWPCGWTRSVGWTRGDRDGIFRRFRRASPSAEDTADRLKNGRARAADALAEAALAACCVLAAMLAAVPLPPGGGGACGRCRGGGGAGAQESEKSPRCAK